jgi:putative membrane protein
MLLLPLLASIIASCGDNQKAKNFNNKTLVDGQGMEFIKTANEAGLTEVKASTIAGTMSKNPRVIGFAKMMIDDHTQAGKELTDLADDKMVDQSDLLKPEHQKTIDSIAKLSGPSFDKAYMNMMVNDHIQAVALFEKTSSNKNNAVQKFARKMLPALKMHLDSARVIAASLK